MGKQTRMDQVKYIIKAYIDTGSIKGTARRLQISKNTVRDYVRRIRTHFKDLSEVLKLSEEELSALCYHQDGLGPSLRELDFDRRLDYFIRELRRVGVTSKLLWEEYCEQCAAPYGYSQFCERLNQAIGRRDLTLSLQHAPGEKMQVDFAGKELHWVATTTGEMYKCPVLIAAMPHTQHSFAVALPSQKVTDFVHGLNQALLYFGRLPRVILSDNLKAFVTRADKYEPDLNALCVQLAAHYQIDLEATRVRRPKDKGSVENLVSTLYTRIYAPLRDDVFHSLSALNAAIRQRLEDHNSRPYQQKPGCRLQAFMEYEYPLMRDLPSDLFEIRKTTQSKVRRDYHVYIGEENNSDSVPFQYVGGQSTVVYTSTHIEVCIDHERVATHPRLQCRHQYRHQTNHDHMPQSHQEWEKARGFNVAYFIKEAGKVGPSTHWAISYIMRSAIHPTQSFNACQGVLRLASKYSAPRLEQACLRLQSVDKASYRMLKNILQRNLDQANETPGLFTSPTHENIRGPQEYQ